MEYEKHINRLVLGFLKAECRTAYNAFAKHILQSQGRAPSTTIAGMGLKDILKIHSQISEILLERIEDSDYCKIKGNEYLAPPFLVDQLLFVLDNVTCALEARSPVGESHIQNDLISHSSDIQSVAELSTEAGQCRHSKSPLEDQRVNKINSITNLPTPDKETISEVMTQTLLHNTEFQEKLANTITTVLNTSDSPPVKETANNALREGVNAELDNTIKNILRRTEEDPIFEEVLQEFLGTPVAKTINKAIKGGLNKSSSSSDDVSKCNSTEQVRQDSASLGYSSEGPGESVDVNKANHTLPPTSNNTMHAPIGNGMPVLSTSTQPVISTAAVSNPFYVNNPGGLVMFPPSYYVVNQPAQSIVVQSAVQTTDLQQTWNRQNVYGNPLQVVSSPLQYRGPPKVARKRAEAKNIQDYISMYDARDESPILKIDKVPKKILKPIKPKAVFKIEAFPNSVSIGTKVSQECSAQKSDDKAPPSDGNVPESNGNVPESNDNVPESNGNVPESNGNVPESNGNVPESAAPSVGETVEKKDCTPSSAVAVVQKKTPKSGNHVRSLSFPSPVKPLSADKLSKIDTSVDLQAVEPIAGSWDANLRKYIEPEPPAPAKAKKARTAAKKKETEVESYEGRLLEEALRTPVKGETVDKPRPTMNEQTPVKTVPLTPSITSSKNETPFTPMLRANLKEITGGDIFSIDTPNFPVTPGFSFMNTTSTYYMCNENDAKASEEVKNTQNQNDLKKTPGGSIESADAVKKKRRLKLKAILSANMRIVKNVKARTKGDKNVSKSKTAIKPKKSDTVAETLQNAVHVLDKDNVSKEKETKPPKRSKKSPKTKTKSPKTRTKSPKTRTKSPKTRTKSPKTKTKSPAYKSRTKGGKKATKSEEKCERIVTNSVESTDDQCKWFKMSGANLHRTRSKTVLEKSTTKCPIITETSEGNNNDHVLKQVMSQVDLFTICDRDEKDAIRISYDKNNNLNRKKSEKSRPITQQKVTVFCEDNKEVDVFITLTTFQSLLDINSSNSKAQNTLSIVTEENRATDRKRRNSGPHSPSSLKKKMKPVDTTILKELNITSFLSQVHGPSEVAP